MKDGPNLLSTRGAACTIGRDKCEVQIRIICDTEEEAKRILYGFRDDINRTGQAHMFFGGTIDEAASDGKMQ